MTDRLPHKNIFRVQRFAVLIGVLLLLAKFSVYFLTHSNTILTDAFESIINVVAGSFALYSLYLSSQPKDYNHPYGHGKVEFISAGFEGILIVLSGFLIIGKAVFSFYKPRQLEHLDTGIAVVVVSGLINLIMGIVLERAGQKNNSLIMKADGRHLKADAYTSAGIFIGLLLIIFTGLNYLDNVVAILFSLIIIYTGAKLIRKSVAGIMDEADESVMASIVARLNLHRKPAWIDIHNLRVIQFGEKLHVDCHATIPWYYTLEEAHREIEEIATIINNEFSVQVEFFIHGDPCIRESCKICLLSNCPVRKEAFKYKVEWSIDNVRLNKKHGL